MLRRTVPLLIILITILISLFFVLNSPTLSDGTATIISDDFVLSFLGIFSSLAIAVITFLYSNIERIRQSVLNNKHINNKDAFEYKIVAIFKELQHNTVFILIALISCFLLVLLRDLDFSLINISIKYILKLQFIATLELSFILLTFVSIKDIIGSLFNLVKISSIIITNSEEKSNG